MELVFAMDVCSFLVMRGWMMETHGEVVVVVSIVGD